MSGPLIPFIAMKWWGIDFKIIFPIYCVAMLFTIVMIAITRIGEYKDVVPNRRLSYRVFRCSATAISL